MKVLFSIGFVSILAFTHPFARDGSVEIDDSELYRDRIERMRDNEEALDHFLKQEQLEESEERDFDVTRSDREKAEALVR